MSSVLVTGAAGFVGRHITSRFRAAGWRTVGFDIRPVTAGELGNSGAFIRGDLLDRSSLEQACQTSGVGGIVHCAGAVAGKADEAGIERAFDVNVRGTLHVLAVAADLNLRVTYISTASVYTATDSSGPPLREEDARPTGLYATTKYMGELLAEMYASRGGLDVVSLRPSYIYGPGSWVGDYFVADAAAGRPVARPNGAAHLCEFTYVADLANAVYLAMTVRPIEHRVFNVSSGELRSRGELADIVNKRLGGNLVSVGPGEEPSRKRRQAMDLSRIRTAFSYKPEYSLERGVAAWIDALG